MERLIAANGSRRETEADAEAIKGEWTEQKKQLQERETGLLDAVDAAESKHGQERWSLETSKAVAGLNDDFRRARDGFEIIDRRKKRTEDQAKKLTERVLQILDEYEQGQADLFTDKTAPPPDQEAWLGVSLADIVGELIARPFAEFDCITVGDFRQGVEDKAFEAALASGDLKLAYLDYASAKVQEYGVRRGKITAGAAAIKSADIPDIVKEKPAPKPAAQDSSPGDEAELVDPDTTGSFALNGAAPHGPSTPGAWMPKLALFSHGLAGSWAGVDMRTFAAGTPLASDKDFIFEMESLEKVNRGTVHDFVMDLLDVFTQRDAAKIAATLADVPPVSMGYICEVIAAGLHAYATPVVYDRTDILRSMCQTAWDAMVGVSSLAKIAARPDSERYGRAFPPVEIGVDGKAKQPAKGKSRPPNKPMRVRGGSGSPKAQNGAKGHPGAKDGRKPAKGAKTTKKKGR